MTEHEQFAANIVTPTLRPGERILCLGMMYNDMSFAVRLIFVFITLWARVLTLKHFFAVVTNQRLILIRSKLKMMSGLALQNLGVETIEFSDVITCVPGFEPAAKRFVIKTKSRGNRAIYAVSSCKGLPNQYQLYGNIMNWINAAAGAGGTIPGTEGAGMQPALAGGAAMPGAMPMPVVPQGPPPLPRDQKLTPFPIFAGAIALAFFGLFSGCRALACANTGSSNLRSVEYAEERIKECASERAKPTSSRSYKCASPASIDQGIVNRYQSEAVQNFVGAGIFAFLALAMIAGSGVGGMFWRKKNKAELPRITKEHEDRFKNPGAQAGAAGMAQPGQAPPASQAYAPQSAQAPSAQGYPPQSAQAPAPQGYPPQSAQAPAPQGYPQQVSQAPQPPAAAAPPQPSPAPGSPLPPGTQVNVTWSNGQRYSATIVQVGQGQYLCSFQGGGQPQWVDARAVSV